MSPLRSPHADPSRPTLRQLGADLKSGLARVLRRPAAAQPQLAPAPTPDPAPDPVADPILAAIAASRQAEAAMEAFGNETSGSLTDEQMAREGVLCAAQIRTRAAVWAMRPTPRAGRLALAAFADFQVGLTIGPNWRADAPRDYYGEPFLALVNAIEAERPDDEPEGADDDLVRLGRLFAAARDREIAACNVANAAQTEAERHEPPRPACLTYRTSDDGLSVYRYWTHPEALEGIEVGSGDVARLRRKMPMEHEVLRPIREGERAHIDHPGRKFDIVPHPEAQARAEEIVTAWDAWRAEIERVFAEHATDAIEREAEEAGDAAADLARRIADLPVRTGAGLRVKLRALAHYNVAFLRTDLPDEPDPDQRLSHSLRQDIEWEVAADAGEPVTVESAASLDLIAHTFDDPVAPPAVWLDKCRIHTLGRHIADRTMRMTKPELIAFVRSAAERGNGADEAMFKALGTAQYTFQGWGKLLDTAHSRYLVAAAAMTVEDEARQAAGGEA